MELIRLEDIYKTYHLGEVDVPVLKGISLSIQPRRDGGADGGLGLGQDHADEHPRLPRPPQLGQVLARRRGDEPADARTSGRWCGPRSSASSSRASTCWPRTTALQNVIMPLDYAPHRPSAAEARQLADDPAGPRGTGRPDRSRALADVRRPAAARGHRPVAGQPPRAGAGRRADRQPRLAHQRGNPADVPAAQRRGDHRHPGDARPEGGRLCPSHDPHRATA